MNIIRAKTAGFCFGVDRAVKLTYDLLDLRIYRYLILICKDEVKDLRTELLRIKFLKHLLKFFVHIFLKSIFFSVQDIFVQLKRISICSKYLHLLRDLISHSGDKRQILVIQLIRISCQISSDQLIDSHNTFINIWILCKIFVCHQFTDHDIV